MVAILIQFCSRQLRSRGEGSTKAEHIGVASFGKRGGRELWRILKIHASRKHHKVAVGRQFRGGQQQRILRIDLYHGPDKQSRQSVWLGQGGGVFEIIRVNKAHDVAINLASIRA